MGNIQKPKKLFKEKIINITQNKRLPKRQKTAKKVKRIDKKRFGN